MILTYTLTVVDRVCGFKGWTQVVAKACPELKTFEAMRVAHPLLQGAELAEVVYKHPSRW